MNEMAQLWKKRMAFFWQDAISYLKIIITGYMYIPIILLILLAFLYNYILKAWPENWSMEWIFALIFSIFITRNQIRTFLKKPDLIYLLPMEDQMKGYFRLSFLYSLMVQELVLLVIMLLLSPLYYGAVHSDQGTYYSIMGYCLVLKAGNLFSVWREWQIRSNQSRQLHIVIRWFFNFLFTLWIFQLLVMTIWAWIGIIVIWAIYYLKIRSVQSYHWVFLLSREEKQMLAFYSFAQWFLDVPQLPVQVKNRSGWVHLIKRIPFQKRTAFHYLYTISFLRYNDIFYLYLRLLGVGILLLFVISHLWLGMATFLIILFLNALQLIPSWKRMNASFWDALYPLTRTDKIVGFCYSIFVFLSVQVFFSAIVLGYHHGWWIGIGEFALGIFLTYLGIYGFLKKKLKAIEN